MKKIFSILIFLASGFLLMYIGLPVLDYGFKQLPILILIWILFGVLIFTKMEFYQNYQKVKVISKPNRLFFIAGLVVLAYLFILPLLTSLPMFRSESYQKLIGKVENGEKISNHIAPISIDEIRVVDEDLAHLLGEKILGSQPALGSQVELGDFCIQKVNNDLYWVAPLLHSGFFKWLNNKEGTAGYVMVSATNERDVKLVQNIGDKNIKIKFQENAFSKQHSQAFIF